MPGGSPPLAADGGASSPSVVVVGAGIVGAALAYRLAARGRTVALFDAGLPASGATGASCGWIGRPGTDRRPSAALRRLAVDEWRRLEHEVPGLNVRWTGSLTWGGVGSSGAPGHAIADAAATGSKEKAWEGFSIHPLVDSPRLGRALLDGYVAAHPSIAEMLAPAP